MGTISHASNRTCFRWLSLLMGIAAVTISLKSIFACGKTAVKVRDTSYSDAKLIFYLCRQELHLCIKKIAGITLDTPRHLHLAGVHYQ